MARKRRAPATTVPAPPSRADERSAAVSPLRRIVFTAMAILAPLILLAAVEAGLRLGGYGHDLSVFVPPPEYVGRGLLRPNPDLGRRYFPGDPNPPGPSSAEPFEIEKSPGELRVVVLGESTAAGFPYLRNGAFSRVLEDALRDAAGTKVVVINVALAAVSSFAPADLLREVLALHPDAIVVYAGHNEYYGAYGVASHRRIAGSPPLVRLALRAQRLRIFQLVQSALRRSSQKPPAGGLVSRMEQLAGDGVALGSPDYRRGLDQIEDNFSYIADAARHAGARVFFGSQASNLRQRPFGSGGGSADQNADTAFNLAEAALRAGDVTKARRDFARARDLDAVRFRASDELNRTLARVATEHGATYVATAEAIGAAAPDSIPGNESFFEHVHPRRPAIVTLARSFFDAMAADSVIGPRLHRERLRPWTEYDSRSALSTLDERLAELSVQSVMMRWPFVRASESRDLLTSYHPQTPVDSAAFAAMIGAASWSSVKLEMANRYIAAGKPDSAITEYRGLMREFPRNELPARLAGLLLERLNRDEEAMLFLRDAQTRGAGADVSAAIARIAQRRH